MKCLDLAHKKHLRHLENQDIFYNKPIISYLGLMFKLG